MDLKYLASDNSYSGNKNRALCRETHIETDFAQKGRKTVDHDGKEFIRKELARVRATSIEGSFGTQKEYYSLRKILSMTRKTEILYIFLGIHTANLVLLAKRIEEMKKTA